jgi:hypothetical protein
LKLKKHLLPDDHVEAVVAVEGRLQPQARPGVGNEFFQHPGPFGGLVFPGVVEFLDEQPGAQPVRDELRVERVVQLGVEHFLFFGFHPGWVIG